ncbi:MAG: ABC transporter permease [Roseivirga sp.]|nr:ABC transporter permease [Roseivirga sp.]
MSSQKIKSPPKWANRFLEWYCGSQLLDEIQGDLLEAFYYRSVEVGDTKARWWFVWDVIRFFRPSSFGKRSYNSNQIAMLRNYLVVSFRNFRSQKGYGFINLSGLIVGITACLLITLHVLEEVTYDNFHPKASQTYRVVMDMYGQGELKTKSAPVYPAVGPGLLADFPEVEMYTRILPFGDGVYSVKQADGTLIRFNENKAVIADENFFEMFGFRLLDGNPESVLSKADQIVLSASTAKRYFGSDNPIGKPIFWRGTRELTVTGVYEDFPENSHMQFDMICSLKTWEGFDEWPGNWGWYDFYTFIKTSEGVDQAVLDEKLSAYLDGKKEETYTTRNVREVLWTQEIGDIHLYSSGISWDMGENGGGEQIYFLSVIAILILLIAWVNYVNLATARAIKRAREVGIRKVVGAQKGNLITQFLVESFLYNAMAVVVSVLLVIGLVPVINSAMELGLKRELLYGPEVLIGLTSLIFLGALITGFYPAMVLTSFKPVSVLKGQVGKTGRKFGFRQILVVFQFTASITLILGTFLVVKQLNYMRSQDLGLNIEQTLVLKSPSSSRGGGDLIERLGLFKAGLEAMPEVSGYTISSNVPGVENFGIGGVTSKYFPNEFRDCYRVRIDDQFMELFEIDLIAGRSFSANMATDTAAVVLNEVAMKHLGFQSAEEALGEKINPNTRNESTIVGVVKSYHQATLKEELDPVVFHFIRRASGSFYSIKLRTEDYSASMAKVEAIWDEIYPDNPFDYFFLDEFFDRQYKADEQFNSVFIGFAGLAIFVACLGLFGLVSFTAEQARKEIGIRKVLGASAKKLVLLLARDYVRLILAAIILSFPLSYYLMREWLNGFAYQTQIGVEIFVFGGMVISMVAFVTVSVKSFQAANGNPVNALRED